MKHCLALLILLLSSAAMAANFEFMNVGSSALHITMSGQINLGDEEKLKKILMKEGRNRQIILRLNSKGGKIKSALNIGRLVRSWGGSNCHIQISLLLKRLSNDLFCGLG